MTLLAVGVSHKSAAADLRSRLAMSADRLDELLGALLSGDAVSEAVILSTCNRSEIYAVALTAPEGVRAIVELLQGLPAMAGADAAELDRALVVKQGPDAVEHLFRVACSLDSLVLGEAQIIGQVRRAFAAAEKAGALQEVLRRLFCNALEVGKRVRDQTAIGKRPVSVSTAALELAERALGTLEGRRALVVGAGEAGLLALGYLEKRGADRVVVANRTRARAEQAVRQSRAAAVGLEALEEELAEADLVVACTSSDKPLITPAMLARALKARGAGERPLVVVDLGMPRSVDPSCGEVAGATCFDLDDLEALLADNARFRATESLRAEGMVAEQLRSFLSWMQERDVIPTVKQMHGKAEGLCTAETARAAKALAALQGGQVSADQRAVLEALAKAVAKKLLHGPTARLRSLAGDADSYRYTEAARYLFGLDAFPQGFSQSSAGGRRCHLAAESDCARARGAACPFHRREESCLR